MNNYAVNAQAMIKRHCFSATSEELMILSAMRTISFVSCIKFVEWDGVRKDYIHFHPHKTRLG